MQLVKDIMSADPLSVPGDAFIDVAIDLMIEKNISGLPVVDDFGELIGLITEFDVLQLYSKQQPAAGYEGQQCRDFMTTEIRSIGQEATLDTAAKIFQAASIRRLLVVDDKRLVGVLSRRDIVRAIRDGRLALTRG
ncbi:MAG: CBS domain-containing protein [Planctomycetota bacterium]